MRFRAKDSRLDNMVLLDPSSRQIGPVSSNECSLISLKFKDIKTPTLHPSNEYGLTPAKKVKIHTDEFRKNAETLKISRGRDMGNIRANYVGTYLIEIQKSVLETEIRVHSPASIIASNAGSHANLLVISVLRAVACFSLKTTLSKS